MLRLSDSNVNRAEAKSRYVSAACHFTLGQRYENIPRMRSKSIKLWMRKFAVVIDSIRLEWAINKYRPFSQSMDMEFLKPLPQLRKVDFRMLRMMAFVPRGLSLRRYNLKQHYLRYASLGWPEDAPVEIVNGFVTAQHLAIYSWFVFPFSGAASLQALITLEHALRRRMGNAPARGLKSRITYAVDQGWIRGDQLRTIAPQPAFDPPPPLKDRPIDPKGDEKLAAFVENLPERRNWLAHGNWNSGEDVVHELDIILQMIIQLYDS
jgi:hypothetical protein